MPIQNIPPSSGPASGRRWALFGATGVTGRLVLDTALARGHRPRLIGRDPERLRAVAGPAALETATAALDDPEALAEALSGTALVLNAAGPFTVTGGPMIEAALAAGVTYIDLNGELAALEALFAAHAAAARRGVALVGGAGFGVAASDGLAAMVSERLGGADWLRVAVAADSAFSSAAVAESTLAVIAGGGREVEGGRIQPRRLARRRWAEILPDGRTAPFASAPLAELEAVRRATGAARIVAGVPMPAVQALATAAMAPLLPTLLRIPAARRALAGTGGHAATSQGRVDHRSRVWIEAGRGDARAQGRLEGGEGYALAAAIAVAALEAALNQALAPGAHSPATAFGAGFIASVPGVTFTVHGP